MRSTDLNWGEPVLHQSASSVNPMKMTVENLGYPTPSRFHEMSRDELVSINKSDLR